MCEVELCYTLLMDLQQVKNILSADENIVFALLFGSYADNSMHAMSDVDIAIYTKTEIDLMSIGYLVATLESALDKSVDLVILNDLCKKNPKLAFNITDKHKLIFCKNRNDYADFKANSLKYYFDTVYMYDMFDRALKERLENGTYGKITKS